MQVTRAAAAVLALVCLLAGCGSSGSSGKQSSPSTSTTVAPSSTTFVSPLKPGPYGFLVPRTWMIATTSGGARITNPEGPGTIEYRVVRGRPSVAAAAGCRVTSMRATRTDRAVFTCARTADGQQVNGVLIRTRSGTKVLTVTLPPAKRDVAMSIAASFRV